MRGCALMAAIAAGLPVAAPGWSQMADVGSAPTAARSPGAMNRLTAPADRLREAVQAMATQPAGDRRNIVIAATDAALRDTEQTTISLPPGSPHPVTRI